MHVLVQVNAGITAICLSAKRTHEVVLKTRHNDGVQHDSFNLEFRNHICVDRKSPIRGCEKIWKTESRHALFAQ